MVNNGMLQLLGSSPIRAARELAVVLQEPLEKAKAIPVVPPVLTQRVRI